jgi:endonuclease YncB( thermonuclease family)
MADVRSLSELQEYLYWYKVRVDFLYDGDSVTAMKLDFGFGFSREVKRGDGDGIRFYGIDAPEMRTKEGKALAKKLKFLEGETIICRSYKEKSGKYGRYLFELYVPTHLIALNFEDISPEEYEQIKNLNAYINLNEYLVEQGFVKALKY